MNPHKQTLLLSLVLLAAVLITFLPAISNDFVGYDDPVYVTANSHVQQGLTWRGVAWAFTTFHAGNWHPLTWLSHMLDCQWFGLQAWGHHLVNIVLHAITVVLCFLSLRRMTGAIRPSLKPMGLSLRSAMW